jgi:hypothetical protein
MAMPTPRGPRPAQDDKGANNVKSVITEVDRTEQASLVLEAEGRKPFYPAVAEALVNQCASPPYVLFHYCVPGSECLVPSRNVLEFADAVPSGMMLSDQEARSMS